VPVTGASKWPDVSLELDEPPSQPPASRKLHKTPHLEEYGHVAMLTLSGGSTKNEPGNPLGRQYL
jgi:hypothetical protein